MSQNQTKFFFINYLILLPYFIVGQATFIKTIGKSGDEVANSGIECHDGNFLIIGSTTSEGNGAEDGLVIKVDINGNTLWTKTIGGTGYDELHHAIQLSNNDFVVVGWTESYGNGKEDVLLVRINNDGDVIWSTTIGGQNDDRGYTLIETIDGDFIVTGWTESYGAGIRDILTMKIDISGNTVWSKTYGVGGNDWVNGFGLIRNSKGNYALSVVWTKDRLIAGHNGIILQFDSNGDIITSNIYGGGRNEGGAGYIREFNGGYQNIGHSWSWNGNNNEVWMTEFDSLLNITWSKTYGLANRNIRIGSVYLTSNNEYLVSGHDFTSSTLGKGFILRINTSGNLMRAHSYDGIGVDKIHSVIETTNSIIAFGYTTSYGNNDKDILLIKSDLDGIITQCSTPLVITTTDVSPTERIPTPITNSPSIGENQSIISLNINLSESIVCTAFPTSQFTISDSIICQGMCINIESNSFSNIETWQWFFTGASITTSNLPNPENICFTKEGQQTIQLIVSNLNGFDTLIKTVEVLPQPNVDLGVDTLICNLQTFTLNATIQDVSYLWSNGGTSPTIEVSEGGTYSVTINNTRCTLSDTITITTDHLFVDLGIDDTICQGDILLLDASHQDADTYLWQDGSTSPEYNVVDNGIFIVEVSNKCGLKTDTIDIKVVQPLINFNLGNDTTICSGDTIFINVIQQNGLEFIWNDEINSPTKELFENGTYKLTIRNECSEVTDEIQILTENCCDIYVPNIFTPNGDGINDNFSISLASDKCNNLNIISIDIYDRWGQQVFNTMEENSPWTGHFNEELVTSGVYIWMITYFNGVDIEILQGDVTVLK